MYARRVRFPPGHVHTDGRIADTRLTNQGSLRGFVCRKGVLAMTTPIHSASQLAVNVLDAHSLLAAFGVLGVGVVMFAETGLLIGFFLPGDSLLFTAGLLCTGSGQHGVKLSLAPLLLAAVVGALAGAQCGILLGRMAGGALLARSRSVRLREGAQRAEELLERYGYAKAIVLARFVPVVRTGLNPMAGGAGGAR